MKSNVLSFPLQDYEPRKLVQKVPHKVRSLAAGLMCLMQIRDGHELVHLIGNGDEYSNQRAVETWLLTNYPDNQLQALTEPLVTLTKALKHHIKDHYYTLEVYSC